MQYYYNLISFNLNLTESVNNLSRRLKEHLFSTKELSFLKGGGANLSPSAIYHVKQKVEELFIQLAQDLPVAQNSGMIITRRKGITAGFTFGEWFNSFLLNFYLEHPDKWRVLSLLFTAPIQIPKPRNLPREYRYRYRVIKNGTKLKIFKDISDLPAEDITKGDVQDRDYPLKRLRRPLRVLLRKVEDMSINVPTDPEDAIATDELEEKIVIAALSRKGALSIQELAKESGFIRLPKGRFHYATEANFQSAAAHPNILLIGTVDNLMKSNKIIKNDSGKYEIVQKKLERYPSLRDIKFGLRSSFSQYAD